MARLTVQTHDSQTFRIPIRNDLALKAGSFQANEWVAIEGSNGNRLILHTKNIASVYFEKGKTVA